MIFGASSKNQTSAVQANPVLSEADTKKLLRETKNWYRDRYQVIVVQRNILALVTLIALAGLGGAVFAVATLNASKTFEPYVIEVEDKTGIVTQLSSQSLEKYKADEMVVRYFLVKYTRAREGYNVDDYQYFYSQEVRVMSSPETYSLFRRQIDISNAKSPINLGRGFTREIEIKSISFLDAKKAQVRFKTLQRDTRSGAVKSEWHAISTVNFEFLYLDLSTQERYINPLGFQVTGYRVDEDRAK